MLCSASAWRHSEGGKRRAWDSRRLWLLQIIQRLFNFPATFLPVSFARQRLFDTQFLARLQIEGMPFDLFNDVFLLDLPFEAPEGVFQGFTVLESYFSQIYDTSKPTKNSTSGKL